MTNPRESTAEPDRPAAGDATLRLPASEQGPKAPIGRVDRYALLQRLGAGSFGAVYRAHDEVADVDVALKALPAVVADKPEELDKVRDNFKLVAKLRHPSIANVLHLHTVENADSVAQNVLGVAAGDHLIVMDYVRGVTITGWRQQFPEGRVPLQKALPICAQIAEALDYAHSQNIIHRDIKPANVLITPEAHVGILDFGLAAQIRLTMSRVSQGVEDRCGTPAYMAPEQWAGRRQGPYTDQYALAVLTYELLSGSVPFASVFQTSSTMLMYNAVKREKPDPLPDLTRRENSAMLRALAKDPRARFRSCASFVRTVAGRRGFAGRRRRRRERALNVPRWQSAIVLLVCLIMAAAGGYLAALRQQAASDAEGEQQRLDMEAGRQQRIARHLRSAESRLEAGLHGEASDAVREALELDPGNHSAQVLREKIATAVGIATVIPLKSEAELELKRTQTLHRGQGFGPALDAARALDTVARTLFEVEEYDLALGKYRDLLADCARLQELDQARRNAKQERQATETARHGAEQADARQHAEELLAGAVQLAASAEEAFEKGEFTQATTLWETGVTEFAKAEASAKGTQVVATATAAYHAELAKADLRLLEDFGGADWAHVTRLTADAQRLAAAGEWNDAVLQWQEAARALQQAVRAAAEAKQKAPQDLDADKPDDALSSARLATAIAHAEEAKAKRNWEAALRFAAEALDIDPESARANELVRQAKTAITPRLNIVAVADGREIEGAEISIDGVLQPAKTPAEFELEQGRDYRIRVRLLPIESGKEYAPFETVYSFKTGGMHKLRAELQQAADDTPGE